MAVKFNFKRHNLFVMACIVLMMSAFSFNAEAQKVRLRSQITPTCSSGSSLWKFADIYADGNIAVQGSYNCKGAFIYDITNPDAPVLASWYNPGNNIQFLEAIVVGNRGYFGAGNASGVHIVDLSNPYSPVLLGTVDDPNNVTSFDAIHEMVVFQQGNQTYLVENYNCLGCNKVLKFINVTDPAHPAFVRDLVSTDPRWIHAIHIRGNRMFTSGWGNGSSARGRTEIYDISNIATQAPVLQGFIEDPNASLDHGNQMHSSWSSEDGNYLYSCREVTSSNGPSPGDVRVYDIHNPAAPVLVNSISMASLGLNAVTPHNPVVMGNYLYVSWYQAGLQVFDISDPVNPKRVGQYDTFSNTFAPTAEEQKIAASLDPWDIFCGSQRLQNLLPTSYDGDWAVFPFLGRDKVLVGDLAGGLFIVDTTGVSAPPKNVVSDFDGDGKTDLSKFNSNTGGWEVINSSSNSSASTSFGLNGDKVAAGDYDGDGKSDIAVWRPGNGVWYSLNSSNGIFRANQFGVSTDIPVPGDFDADGKTDIAVWRPSNGAWYIQQSTLGLKIVSWGVNGDKPLVGDYEGDGKADPTIYRNGSWYILQSSSSIPMGASFGLATDKPLAGDFDGDGKSDLAVFRPSTGVWYVFKSSINNFTAINFGLATDMPVPADYDGDGKADVGVYRPSEGNWYILGSTAGYSVKNFGTAADVPSPSSVNPQ
jgi:hypothetical protein